MDELAGVSELNQVILAEHRGVVIDFWGTWCAPCRSLRPHLEQMAIDHQDDWRFVAVHVENNEDLVEKYGVSTTPTLVFVRNGEEKHRLAGATTPSSVSEVLNADD